MEGFAEKAGCKPAWSERVSGWWKTNNNKYDCYQHKWTRTERTEVEFCLIWTTSTTNRIERTELESCLIWAATKRTRLFDCIPEPEQNRTARDWPNRKELEPPMVGLIFCLPCVPRFCEKKIHCLVVLVHDWFLSARWLTAGSYAGVWTINFVILGIKK